MNNELDDGLYPFMLVLLFLQFLCEMINNLFHVVLAPCHHSQSVGSAEIAHGTGGKRKK
jgi:hypothetical protein